jgi:hypothetical protein
MKIYLVEPNTRYDLTALQAYGTVVFISNMQINPFDVNAAMLTIERGLDSFDPTEDYICLTGNLQSVALMMMVVYSLHKTFKVLMFDARTSNYRERIISDER